MYSGRCCCRYVFVVLSNTIAGIISIHLPWRFSSSVQVMKSFIPNMETSVKRLTLESLCVVDVAEAQVVESKNISWELVSLTKICEDILKQKKMEQNNSKNILRSKSPKPRASRSRHFATPTFRASFNTFLEHFSHFVHLHSGHVNFLWVVILIKPLW